MLKDQKEFLSALNAHGVKYLVVGGHAVNAHGVPRTTKDLNVFIRSEQDNTEKLFVALAKFGAPLRDLTEADFRNNPQQIVQIGVEPSRVDILQDIGGVPFESAWSHRLQGRIDSDITAPFISREDLIQCKKLSAARATWLMSKNCCRSTECAGLFRRHPVLNALNWSATLRAKVKFGYPCTTVLRGLARLLPTALPTPGCSPLAIALSVAGPAV